MSSCLCEDEEQADSQVEPLESVDFCLKEQLVIIDLFEYIALDFLSTTSEQQLSSSSSCE